MGEWGLFLWRIVRPVIRLFGNVGLFLYFLFGICFFGALGVWLPVGQLWQGTEPVNIPNIYHNLATYIIGITVIALADYIKHLEDDSVAFHLFIVFIAGFSGLAAVILLNADDQALISKWWPVGSILAAYIWLYAHDSDPDLTSSDSLSTLGGKVSQ